MGRATVLITVCLAALCALPCAALGQIPGVATGTIVGVVLDGSSGDPIIEAGVEIVDVGTKTRTDLDGKYRLKATPGTYELRVFAPLYQGTRLRNVVVAEGKETTANASLKPEGEAAVEVVEVVAEARKAAEATQLLQRKAAPVVSDNIGAEEAKKAPDSDAAEIVQRLPSITISEDDFVFVRGLGERYTLGVLGKSRLPSTDPDKRVVPLNVFPADFIESINILKTAVPSMPGDAAGALVDINLKDPPDRLTYGIGMSISANTQATFKSFDSYKGGRYDYFGFGKDYRTPEALPDEFPSSDPMTPPLEGGARQRAAAGVFRNIWNIDTDAAPPDWDLNFNVGNAWGPVSFSLFGKYKNEHKRRANEVVGDTVNQQGGVNEFIYRRSEFETELSSVLTGAWRISPEHKLNLRSFVYHYSNDEVLNGSGTTETQPDQTLFPTFLEFEEGKLGVGQLTGGHHFDWLDVDWRTALAQTTRFLPDRRFYRYFAPNDGSGTPPQLETRPPALLREFDELEELLTDSAVDVTVPFPIWSSLSAKVQTGLAYSHRQRDYALRRFQYERPGGGSNPLDTTLTPEDLLILNNIGTHFEFNETTTASDSFEATQEILGYYGQLDLPIIRDRLRLVAGVRLEYSYIISRGAFLTAVGTPPDFEIPINDLDPLPAVNLVYSPRNDMNVRFGFSQGVSRPEFRELQPTLLFQPPGERPVVGNPELVSAAIDSYDLRWEWFFGDRELVSLGGFYKDLTDPIEKTTLKFATFNADTFTNALSATLYGFEIEGRKNFNMLAPLLRRAPATEPAIPYLANVRLVANVSYIESEADVVEFDFVNNDPNNPMPVQRKRPLQGQPTFVVNAALEYDQPEFLTTRLSYYTFGERLESGGIVSEGIPDTFEQRRDQLDFVFIKPFKVYDTPLNAKFSVENILNDQFLELQDDFVARRFTTGVKFTLGVSYTF
jgi:hypothetical protein